MKRYKSILLVLFSILGCQSEIEQEINSNENAIPMSFYAGIEIPKDSILTKTVLGGSPSDAFRNVLWEYQDEVYVTNGSQSSKFINTCLGRCDFALLEGELPPSTDYYAVYPYYMVKNYNSSEFLIEIPSVQAYYKDGIAADSFPMVATSDDGIFSFQNLCGVFVLQLTGDETISSVTFSGMDASGIDIPVSGNGTILMDYSVTPSLIMKDSAKNSVTLECADGVRLNPTIPTTFHIVLPVGIYNTFNVSVKATDGTEMTIKSQRTLEIKRSTRTTAANLSYSGVIQYKDLNESDETANSYIISSSGHYKFKTCKGNSTDSIGDVNSAEVIWESFGTDVTPSIGDLVKNVLYKDGYIQFSIPSNFKEGNAVIAAKDASETILWSWHIWLTDKPKEQVYYNNAGTMMDRNLGATSATPGDATSLGLLYQWGRKDPFLSFSDISSTSIASSTYEWPLEKELATSIEYTINNPTTFIIGSYGNSFDWLYIPNWSQGTLPDATRWQSSKTIYDPCPSGWRVPDGGSDGIWYKAMSTSTYTYDSSHIGVNFSKIFGNDEVIWYPASGYYFGGGAFGKENRGSTFYWSVTVTPGDADRIYDLYISSEKVNPRSHDSRTQGLYVRCMKINN